MGEKTEEKLVVRGATKSRRQLISWLQNGQTKNTKNPPSHLFDHVLCRFFRVLPSTSNRYVIFWLKTFILLVRKCLHFELCLQNSNFSNTLTAKWSRTTSWPKRNVSRASLIMPALASSLRFWNTKSFVTSIIGSSTPLPFSF